MTDEGSTATQDLVRRSAPLAAVSLAYFMVLLDVTVLAVAEPDIMYSLHTDAIGVGWATSVYTLTLAALLVLGGVLVDRFGASRLFVGGVVAFGTVSVLCAAAPGIWSLVVFRGLLGLCAAVIIPASLAVLAQLFPGPATRARAIGVWASVSGSAMAGGPVLGGLLTDAAGWRAVFLINAPIAVAVLLLGRRALPGGSGHRRPVDLRPHVAFAGGLAALTFAVAAAGQARWAWCGAAVVAAALLAAVAAWSDARARTPIVPSALRRGTGVWMVFGWGAVVNFALTTVLFVIPIRAGTSPTETGMLLLPLTLLMVVNPLLTGHLVARFGAVLPVRLGLAASTLGTVGVGAALESGGEPSSLVVPLLLCGLGVSWALPALVGHAVGMAPADAVGSVGGLLNAARQVGATLGAAVAGAVLYAAPAAAGIPLFGAAALCACALLVSFRGAGPRTPRTGSARSARSRKPARPRSPR